MNFSDKYFQFALGHHHGKEVIWIRFDKNNELIQFLRQNTRARWSASQRKWYVADNKHYRQLFGLEEKITGKEVISKIPHVNLPEFTRSQEHLKRQASSPSTLRTYPIPVAQLLHLLKHVPARTPSPERLRSYFLYCHDNLQRSDNHIHSRSNAVQFYYEQV